MMRHTYVHDEKQSKKRKKHSLTNKIIFYER